MASIVMLRKFQLNCKLNIEFFSTQDLKPSLLNDFKPELERCPFCNALGKCRPHGSYKRWLTDIDHGEMLEIHVKVPRVICTCGHTHGALTDNIIPYRWYSLPFILYVLGLYLSRSVKLKDLCEKFKVSYSTIYRWKAIFVNHKMWWLGALQSDRTLALAFLNTILGYPVFSDFTQGFFQKTLYSFLQSHANPANCDHRPTGWLTVQEPPT